MIGTPQARAVLFRHMLCKIAAYMHHQYAAEVACQCCKRSPLGIFKLVLTWPADAIRALICSCPQMLHTLNATPKGFLSLGSCFVAAMGNSTGTTLTAMFLHFNAIIVEHCEMSEFVYSQIFESLIVYKSYG